MRQGIGQDGHWGRTRARTTTGTERPSTVAPRLACVRTEGQGVLDRGRRKGRVHGDEGAHSVRTRCVGRNVCMPRGMIGAGEHANP